MRSGGHTAPDTHGPSAAEDGGGLTAHDTHLPFAAPAQEHAGHDNDGNHRDCAGNGTGHVVRDNRVGHARPDPNTRGQLPNDDPGRCATTDGDGQTSYEDQPRVAIPANNSEGHCADDAQAKVALNGEVGDHPILETQDSIVSDPADSSGGQSSFEIQSTRVPKGEAGDQPHRETQNGPISDFAAQLDALIEFDHKYGFWTRQTTTLTNRLKGMGRRLYAAGNPDAALKDIKQGGKLLAEEIIKALTAKKPKTLSAAAQILQSAEIDTIEAYRFALVRRTFYEARITAIAELSPVVSWWCSIKGCSLLGLGRILAQLGPGGEGKPSLDNYGTVSRVWKRLGLACVSDGTRQRRVKGAAGIEHGFNPQRCAVVFGFVDAMFRHQGTEEKGTATLYRKVYDARRAKKEVETETDPTKGHWTKGHLNNDARRIVAKELMKHLWIEWRRASLNVKPSKTMPAAGRARCNVKTPDPVPDQVSRQATGEMKTRDVVPVAGGGQ